MSSTPTGLENYLSRVLDLVAEGIAIVDSDGRYSFVNPSGVAILGQSQAEIVGRPYTASLWHLETMAGARIPVEDLPSTRVLRGGEAVYDTECVLVRPDGTRVIISVDAVPFKDEAGGRVGTIISFSDITRRQRRHRLSDALDDINIEIASTLDFDSIMQRTIDSAVDALGCESGVIYLREGAEWVMRYLRNLPEEMRGTRIPDDERAAFTTLTGGQARAVAINDAYRDERIVTRLVRQFRIQSLLDVTLRVRGRTIGDLSFHYHSRRGEFSQEDIDFANKLGTAVGLALENAQLYSDASQIANTLQTALLESPPELPNVIFGHLYRAGAKRGEVGGDFYDVFRTRNGQIGLIVGDVSGKGVEAATLAARVKNTAKAYLYADPDTAEAAAKTNEIVAASTPSNWFATAFLGVLDPDSGALRYCNAGHPPALVLATDGKVRALPEASPLLGAYERMDYAEQETVLRPGDVLLAYTDGVIEARHDRELYGQARLERALRDQRGTSPGELPEAIMSGVSVFTDGRISDDVVILALALGQAP